MQQVRPLAGIAAQVVELRRGARDVFEVAPPQRRERGPAEGRGIAGLRVELLRRRLAAGPQAGREVAAVERGRLGEGVAGEARERGRQVDEAHRRLHHPRLELPGGAQQQRHVEGRLVEEEAVGHLAVLAQPLAVVGGHRHHRLAVQALDAELLQDAPHLLVHGGDLAVVGAAGVARGPGGRRGVGGVGVVEVHPEEERARVVLRHPAERPVHHHAPGPFRLQDVAGLRIALDLVVVDLEARLEAEAVVEHEGAEEGAGAVAGAGEQGGEGRGLRTERAHPVVAQAVVGGQQSREQARMRGERERHRRGGVGEPHPLAGQPVEPGGHRLAVAVAADVVGADGVQSDQNEVWVTGGALARAAGDPENEEREERGPGELCRSWLTQSKIAPRGIPGEGYRNPPGGKRAVEARLG